MAGEIMCNKDEVANILGKLNAICTNLQSAESELNGIDASSLGVANLNTIQEQEIINEIKGIINNIGQRISDFLEELENGDSNNTDITNKLIEIFWEDDEIRRVLENMKIPTYPDCYQSDEIFSNIDYGKYNLSIDGCGLFSCYYILKLLGNTEITPEFLAKKIYGGATLNDGAGSDGGSFGGLAQLLEIFRSKNFIQRI